MYCRELFSPSEISNSLNLASKNSIVSQIQRDIIFFWSGGSSSLSLGSHDRCRRECQTRKTEECLPETSTRPHHVTQVPIEKNLNKRLVFQLSCQFYLYSSYVFAFENDWLILVYLQLLPQNDQGRDSNKAMWLWNGRSRTKLSCYLLLPEWLASFLCSIRRQKGDLDKETRESQSAASAAQQRWQELETAVKDFLEKAQIQPGNDLSATLQVNFSSWSLLLPFAAIHVDSSIKGLLILFAS